VHYILLKACPTVVTHRSSMTVVHYTTIPCRETLALRLLMMSLQQGQEKATLMEDTADAQPGL